MARTEAPDRSAREATVELYRIPLGAGGHSVRFNGKVDEALTAARLRRQRRDLYHAALVVSLDGERSTIEVAPSPDTDELSRGVVATGAVGSRWAGWLRLFRYRQHVELELRRRLADRHRGPAHGLPAATPVRPRTRLGRGPRAGTPIRVTAYPGPGLPDPLRCTC
jgi:hypothetical protein